jgi:hypothetical protein
MIAIRNSPQIQDNLLRASQRNLVEPNKAAHVLAKINSKHKYRHRSVPLSFETGAILTDRSREGRAIP